MLKTIIVNVRSITDDERKRFIDKILHKVGYGEIWLITENANIEQSMKTFLYAHDSCTESLPDYYSENAECDIYDNIADEMDLSIYTYDSIINMLIDSVKSEMKDDK